MCMSHICDNCPLRVNKWNHTPNMGYTEEGERAFSHNKEHFIPGKTSQVGRTQLDVGQENS